MILNNSQYDVAVKFEGELACFTRPEFKVERVTYPVITPSAARGALEAIFWKPEFRWEIREIWLLKPIKQIAIMRNEVDSRQSNRTNGFFIEDKRQQRTSLFLKDVSYLIFADVRLKEDVDFHKKKYIEQFNRRVEKGQCHHQPYLGTRECSAYFDSPAGNEVPKDIDMEIGNMLFDIAYRSSENKQDMKFVRHLDNEAHIVDGYVQPLYFMANLDKGILKVPVSKYQELYRLEGVNVKGIS